MSGTERDQELVRLLEEAVQLPTEQQWSFLESAASDKELAREVEALLRGQTELGGFMAEPVGELLEDVRSELDAEHDLIGPYRILESLGRGGMGEVYRAEQREPVRREVALKVIKQGMDTRQVVARFEAERQALALMDHPAIATVYSAGATPKGRPYFAMELVRGVPITEHCDRERLTLRERLRLFALVCDGVQHAHRKAVIHRDLKPSNVLVAVSDDPGSPSRWSPKIIDFGIAKATAEKLTEESLHTRLGAIVGTPGYMSPEQAAGGEDIDTRSDVYSLGVILYVMLVGAQPFDPEALRQGGLEALVRRIQEQEAPRPSTRLSGLDEDSSSAVAANRRTDLSTLRRELSGDLEHITLKALEKDRERRYQSPRDLAADLERYLADEPILARPPSAAYQARKFVRRHRTGVSVVSSGLVLLIAFAISMAVQTQRIAAERDRANAAAERAEREAQAKGQVSDFLQGLFSVSDPSSARGQTITARELLERGAKRIDTELADQPDLQAEMMHVIGVVYRELGLYEPAKGMLTQAVAKREEVLGVEALETLSSRQELADLYLLQGRLQEAEQLSRQTLEMREQILGAEHPGTLDSLDSLAEALEQLGLFSDAEQHHRRAYEVKARILDANHLDTLRSLGGLGKAALRLGRYAEAETLYRRVLDGRQRQQGADHPATLDAVHGLALSLIELGRSAEAEPLIREILEARKRVLGEEHPRTIEVFSDLASALKDLGRLEEAEKLDRKSLEAEERVLGPDHPWTLGTLRRLADSLARLGRMTEAEEIERRLWETQRRVLGEEHPQTLSTLSNLADSLAMMGREGEAEPLYRRALEGYDRTLGEDHPDTNGSRTNLGLLLWTLGRYDEAEVLHRQTFKSTLRSLGEDHPRVVWDRSFWARALMALGRFDEAESQTRESLRVGKRNLDRNDLAMQLTRNVLGEILARTGRPEEARELLRTNLAITTRFSKNSEVAMAEAHYGLALVEVASGNRTAAVDHFRRALELDSSVVRLRPGSSLETLLDVPEIQVLLQRATEDD